MEEIKMKKILCIMILMNILSFLSARESTPLSELEMIGNYIFHFYKNNSKLPASIEELKTMHYLTDTDVRVRLTSIEKQYNFYISDFGKTWIIVVLENDKMNYSLKILIKEDAKFFLYKDSELVDSYQKRINGETQNYTQQPNIITSK